MKAVSQLPEGYREIYSINLQKDKKMALLVNLIGIVLMAVLMVPMHFVIPISSMVGMSDSMGMCWFRLAMMLVLAVLYMVLHELVHGVAMKICGTKKIKYGFTGMYAYAGSEDYYAKKPYIFIALAPVVLWGVVIALINPFVPTEWFWVVYMIQVVNLSGAAGDLFVTMKFSRMPKDILVQDSGLGMTVYSKM